MYLVYIIYNKLQGLGMLVVEVEDGGRHRRDAGERACFGNCLRNKGGVAVQSSSANDIQGKGRGPHLVTTASEIMHHQLCPFVVE